MAAKLPRIPGSFGRARSKWCERNRSALPSHLEQCFSVPDSFLLPESESVLRINAYSSAA